mmetsp:Transcript_8891/g.23326  ORF Transcript_8891/g.23326 Transcript_8891/m.23326 type:complete len:216 (-) Transcript_8891:235-882(-)
MRGVTRLFPHHFLNLDSASAVLLHKVANAVLQVRHHVIVTRVQVELRSRKLKFGERRLGGTEALSRPRDGEERARHHGPHLFADYGAHCVQTLRNVFRKNHCGARVEHYPDYVAAHLLKHRDIIAHTLKQEPVDSRADAKRMHDHRAAFRLPLDEFGNTARLFPALRRHQRGSQSVDVGHDVVPIFAIVLRVAIQVALSRAHPGQHDDQRLLGIV